MTIEYPSSEIYTPLDASLKQIRLLHLLPGKGEDDLKCTLSVVSLNDKPYYEALSYVWGNVKDTVSLLLEEQTKQVTRNLQSALRGTRYPDSERILWVDAVCINQGDKQEVNAQVAIMGDIYAKADYVVAYIGDDFDGCKLAIESMNYVSENDDMHFEGPQDTLLQVHGKPFANGGISWDAIYQFFETPWTSRVWTAQENVLAKDMLVYRSRMSIPRQTLNDFMDYVPRHLQRGCCRYRKEHKIVFHDEIFLQWRAFFGPPKPDTSILLPLEYYRARESGKVHDKIYGMLGLSGDRYKERITVDYTVDAKDLFTTVASVEGEVTGRLDFLSYCRTQKLTLPSWVPDWTVCDPKWADARREGLFLSRYKADGDRPSGSFVPIGRKLFTFGVQVGKIYRHCKPKGTLQMHTEGIAHLWNFTTRYSASASHYRGTQGLEMAFWLTMCGGLDALSRPDKNGMALTYKRLSSEEYASAIELWKEVVYEEQEYGALDVLFAKLTIGRCFIVMENGAIGFAPTECRLGDVVVVLSGGSLPYVLRPVHGGRNRHEYTFVGDAYIHGLMDGEAFAGIEHGTEHVEAFTLV